MEIKGYIFKYVDALGSFMSLKEHYIMQIQLKVICVELPHNNKHVM